LTAAAAFGVIFLLKRTPSSLKPSRTRRRDLVFATTEPAKKPPQNGFVFPERTRLQTPLQKTQASVGKGDIWKNPRKQNGFVSQNGMFRAPTTCRADSSAMARIAKADAPFDYFAFRSALGSRALEVDRSFISRQLYPSHHTVSSKIINYR